MKPLRGAWSPRRGRNVIRHACNGALLFEGEWCNFEMEMVLQFQHECDDSPSINSAKKEARGEDFSVLAGHRRAVLDRAAAWSSGSALGPPRRSSAAPLTGAAGKYHARWRSMFRRESRQSQTKIMTPRIVTRISTCFFRPPLRTATRCCLPSSGCMAADGLPASKGQIANYARILAGKGYTVVGIDYSIAPRKTYPTPVRQLNTALSYLEQNAPPAPRGYQRIFSGRRLAGGVKSRRSENRQRGQRAGVCNGTGDESVHPASATSRPHFVLRAV